MVFPTTGYIDAGAEQCLRVLYLPGIPEVFKRQFQLQLAFLPPQDITLTGEGVFPRISLDLPRNLSAEECYSDVVQQARTAVEADKVRKELINEFTTGGQAATEYEELLHMEIERMLVKENALAVTRGLLEFTDSQGSSRKWHKLSKLVLLEYSLDFGYVIPSKVLSHTVNVTNNASVPVSFHANRKPLTGTGFSAEFERVKDLPCGEIQTFTIKFDPKGTNRQTKDISVIMPIQVTGGPVVQVRLCAAVTMPAVTVSTDTLLFDTVQCGMCQVDKFLPLFQRKKFLQEQRPPLVMFEAIPTSDMLLPGERLNVRIKFTPAEGHAYNRQIVVRVAESTQQVFITAQGQGEEPQLDFCPSVVELGPCLPASTQVEVEVTVKKPRSFPIEFYSLEFDTQYLEEEKILRLMQDYDENNMLLLPPRTPGESLPTELLDYYKEYCSHLKDDELKAGLDKEATTKDGTLEEEARTKQINRHPADDNKEEEIHTMKPAELFISEMTKYGISWRLEQVEMTPVSRAIARHIQ